MPPVVVRVWPREPTLLLRRAFRLLTITVVALFIAASTGEAQRLTISPVRGVQFGLLFPGIPRTVAPSDPVRAGVLQLQGPNGAQVALFFILPSNLRGPSGARLPISYSATSGGYTTGATGGQVLFDPRVIYRPRLSASGRGTIFVGAIATPAPNQRNGTYNATIIVIAALTGS